LWSCVQAQLACRVDQPTYRIWLEPLRARELTHGRLLVEAPADSCGWICDRFGRLMQSIVTSVLGTETPVELVARGEETRGRSSRGPGSTQTPAQAAGAPRALRAGPSASEREPLDNPKLTFDQFVIGDRNRL